MKQRIEISERDLNVLARSERFQDRRHRNGPRNAILFNVKNRALEGKVIEYDKAFAKGESIYVLKPGCFDAHRKKRVGFQAHHIASTEVANTNGALEIFYLPDSVNFRLDLEKTQNGAVIGRMCESGSHTAMSIGAVFENAREETIAGHKVTVVHKARLDEISICKEGAAGDQAFAFLVDKRTAPRPLASMMNTHQSLHKINRKVRGLKQRINAMADEARHVPVRATSVSVDVMNLWQSEETERLQEMARNFLR